MSDVLERIKEAQESWQGSAQQLADGYLGLHAAEVELVQQHTEAFAGGVIIERVLYPRHLKYMAGYRRMFDEQSGSYDFKETWLQLDIPHAEMLAGAWLKNAEFSQIDQRRDIPHLDQPQHDLSLTFSVAGFRVNAVPSVDRPSEDFTKTEYRGNLSAIEWRLPTDGEVRALESSPAN